MSDAAPRWSPVASGMLVEQQNQVVTFDAFATDYEQQMFGRPSRRRRGASSCVVG